MARFLCLLALAIVAACKVSGGTASPPVGAGPGVIVDPLTGVVSVDKAKVPLVGNCPAQTAAVGLCENSSSAKRQNRN